MQQPKNPSRREQAPGPGMSGRRQGPHTPGGHSGWNKLQRIQRALARQAMRDSRTASEQLTMLDSRLGVDVGAKKERTRLS